MAKIKMIKRYVYGDYKAFCKKCNEIVEITTDTPIEIEMPYCNEYGKIVLDTNQNYCCWCGESFES